MCVCVWERKCNRARSERGGGTAAAAAEEEQGETDGERESDAARRCVGDEGERVVVVFVEKGELCVSWQRARVNFSNSVAAPVLRRSPQKIKSKPNEKLLNDGRQQRNHPFVIDWILFVCFCYKVCVMESEEGIGDFRPGFILFGKNSIVLQIYHVAVLKVVRSSFKSV